MVARVRRALPTRVSGELRVALGDDSAILRPKRGNEWAISTDALIEGMHFLPETHPPNAVGYKAIARATSDLGAMGARPRFFFLNLALPSRRTGRWLDGCLRGMARAARRYGLTLAGGDTSRSKAITLNLTVLGEIPLGLAVLRSGARTGDWIFATGKLGAAELGLEIMMRGLSRQAGWRKFLRAQLYPEPPVELGLWLAGNRLASAMMDLSDGLSTDLARLCSASGVGARISAVRMPVVGMSESIQRLGLQPIKLALHGGEDYQLLFTVPRGLTSRIPARRTGVQITRIGEIVPGRGVELATEDGRVVHVERRGWDHFARHR